MPLYIGETNQDYTNGQVYFLMQVPMCGRIYKPDKGVDGKYIDTVGVRDIRIMVWKHGTYAHDRTGYRVYESDEAIAKEWADSSTIPQSNPQ